MRLTVSIKVIDVDKQDKETALASRRCTVSFATLPAVCQLRAHSQATAYSEVLNLLPDTCNLT